MLFEDAQWSDSSSLELLDILIDRLAELPILLAISFRIEFAAPWIGRAGTGLIALSRLNRTLAQVTGASARARPLGTDCRADRWRAALH
jgi:predicted ATPase